MRLVVPPDSISAKNRACVPCETQPAAEIFLGAPATSMSFAWLRSRTNAARTRSWSSITRSRIVPLRGSISPSQYSSGGRRHSRRLNPIVRPCGWKRLSYDRAAPSGRMYMIEELPEVRTTHEYPLLWQMLLRHFKPGCEEKVQLILRRD